MNFQICKFCIVVLPREHFIMTYVITYVCISACAAACAASVIGCISSAQRFRSLIAKHRRVFFEMPRESWMGSRRDLVVRNEPPPASMHLHRIIRIMQLQEDSHEDLLRKKSAEQTSLKILRNRCDSIRQYFCD